MHQESDFSALERAGEQEMEKGLTACQIAVAHDGKVVWTRSFGSVSPSTRFWIASATKPIVSSALWILIGEGELDVSRSVSHYIPEFGSNGMQDVTVEQTMLMTGGFPEATMEIAEGADAEARRKRFGEWTLEWEPGTQYAYHPKSSHYVQAELIERISGRHFCDFVEERVTRPLGLPRLLGIPREAQGDVAQLSEAASDEVRAAYEYAAKIEAGEPGGGALATAESLALFYQGLLHNPGGIWDAEVLADGTGKVRCTLPDPMMKLPANRTLGVVVGPGYGATWSQSETAFGWPGAGGQIGFAEPATGYSFAFLQMGDTDQVTQFIRGAAMSTRALALGTR